MAGFETVDSTKCRENAENAREADVIGHPHMPGSILEVLELGGRALFHLIKTLGQSGGALSDAKAAPHRGESSQEILSNQID